MADERGLVLHVVGVVGHVAEIEGHAAAAVADLAVAANSAALSKGFGVPAAVFDAISPSGSYGRGIAHGFHEVSGGFAHAAASLASAGAGHAGAALDAILKPPKLLASEQKDHPSKDKD